MTSKSTALSDTAHKVLAAAAARDDRLAVEPAKLPRAACSAVARALLRAGYLERIDPEPEALWYPEPGRATSLRVTDAGLHAIGVEPDRDEADLAATETPTVDGQDAPTTAVVQVVAPEPTSPVQAPQDAPMLADTPVARDDSGTAEDAGGAPVLPQAARQDTRTNLRRVAEAVLQAWDDEASQRSGLPTAVERLRALLARPTATRAGSAAPRSPREGTKQAQVLALLRRPKGASGPQIADATGWAPHTVRGFLAGLGKKGVPVAVLERVRQVGPHKQGAKGSYTVYHIGEAG